jgi:5-hydroxyisourate hydrolase
MTRISTHVLDIATGKPRRRVRARSATAVWRLVGTSLRLDVDGRCKELLPEPLSLSGGVYRLAFDTAAYYASQHVSGLYPKVEITFEVRTGESHFHIPLLLSPNGFTTYRGS